MEPNDHCRVCHRTEVLLCVLILSFLDTCIGAVDTAAVQVCLEKMRPIFQKSDALLYAPSIEKGEIGENCKTVSLKCYLLELNVIFLEEGIWERPEAHLAQCIRHFNVSFSESLMKSSSQASSSDSCPPCEAQTLKNATIFLERMFSLLQRMYAEPVKRNL